MSDCPALTARIAPMTSDVGASFVSAALASLAIENCTIVSNVFTKVDGAGGLYLTGNGVTAVNTLVWGNVAKTNEVLLLEAQSDVKVAAGVTATFDHSLAFGLPDLASGQVTVTDCLSADPKFNRGLKASVPYWGVLGTSPCKNKGVKLGWMTGATDLIGNPRVFNGKPDIGCYESQVGGLVIIVR